MRLILAIFLPWLQFFTIGRPIAGIICLFCMYAGWLDNRQPCGRFTP